MKHLKIPCLLLGLLLPFFSLGQESVADLESRLESVSSSRERMALNYQLAEAYLRLDPEKAIDHARSAHRLANEAGNHGMSARSAYMTALAYERERDERNVDVWLRSAFNYAKKAGDSDLIIKSVEKRSRLHVKDRDYRDAYQVVEEAFTYFSGRGTSISDLEQKYEMQRADIAQQKRDLERDKFELEREVLALRNQRDALSTDKAELTEQQKKLLAEKELVESKITEREKDLDSIQIERNKLLEVAQEAKKVAAKRESEYKLLSKEALADKASLEEARAIVAEAKIREDRNKFIMLIAAIVGVFLLLLVILSYSRYRSSRRAKKSLEDKNKLIDEERKRSDELLLNILPAPIAAELKENGKARARKFPDVTVLFSDFKNFTGISEILSPEELVEELDKCFKAFDFIIGQYDDIEKIKTIGDAYMCASGLDNRRSMPTNLVKAALEMQEFLEEQKQERMRLGKPYFEARIGMHTGPAVAGVVGVNKFSYDIWGDTVNIASRVETLGILGRVNISESTYNMVKYKFECAYRGKVDAKNKGMIDMYTVERVKDAAAVPTA